MSAYQAGPFGGNENSGSVDLGQIGQALKRRKYWIIGPTLGALLLGTMFVTLVKPRYTAEAKVLLENQEGYLTRPDKASAADPNITLDAEAVQSQVQLVQSRDLARRAIKELNLVGNSEFDPQAGGGSALGRVLIMLGLQRAPTLTATEDRILDTYFEKLNVFSVVKTRVLSIEFSSIDPDLAARASNTIADIYLDVQSAAKRNRAKGIAASLNSLITDLKMKTAEAESKAERFRLQSGLLVGANNLTITAQQLSEINAQLTVARGTQADTQAKARLIRDMLRQNRLGEVPDIANNDTIRRLSEQRFTLRAQLAQESQTLLPGHPRIKELSAQLAGLDNDLRAAGEKTARTLENDARIAGSRVENLQATLDAQKKVAGTANKDDVTLRRYDSDARLLKDQLEANTTKYQEAVALENALSTPADARVISRAIVPALPSFPKKIPILFGVTLAALVFSTGGIIAGQLLSGAAALPPYPLPRPVPARGADPLLGRAREDELASEVMDKNILHDKSLAKNIVQPRPQPAQSLPESAMAASQASLDLARNGEALARRVSAAGVAGHAVVTMLAGYESGAVTSTAAVSLSRALARSHRVILVNLDERARDIDSLAPQAGEQGLADLLAGHASFAEVIHRDQRTRLHVLTHGGGRISGMDGLDLVLDALCETYDHVVLAAPSLQGADLATSLAPYADFAFITTLGPTADAAVQFASDDLVKAGAGDVLVISAAPAARAPETRQAGTV